LKSYFVFKPRSELVSAVVVAAGAVAPQEQLDEVAADLRRLGVSGTVVFDLLAANGTKSRRFFAAPFDGARFRMKFERVSPDSAVEAASNRFLSEHADEVDLSLVPSSVRKEVLRPARV